MDKRLVKFNDLQKQLHSPNSENNWCVELERIMSESSYILGDHVSQFEDAFADYHGEKWAVGVNSGTDAIKISSFCLSEEGKKNVFFVPANTFIATVTGIYEGLSVAGVDFEIIPIDCGEDAMMCPDNLLAGVHDAVSKFGPCNMVAVPVHLYGFTCDMESIKKIAVSNDMQIIEDCSQAHGAEVAAGKKAGCFSNLAAYSCYPGKNLGALGDAGIIISKSYSNYRKCRELRNLGGEKKFEHADFGFNSRLDSIQAMFLNFKLPKLEGWNACRRAVAKKYFEGIENPSIRLPLIPSKCAKAVFHVFPVYSEEREELAGHLNKLGVETGKHYPHTVTTTGFWGKRIKTHHYTPNADKLCGETLSLPIHPFMAEREVDAVIEACNSFKK